LLLLLVATSNSFAAEFTPPPLPSVTAVHLGFGEKYKLGCWTPLVVNLRGATVAVRGTISVTVPDGDGVGVRFRSEPVDVPIGLDAQAAFYVNIGRHIDQLQVDFEHDRILSGEPRALSSVPIADPLELGTKLFVNVGPLVASAEALATRGAVLVGVERLDQLPDRWIGYEGVDGLIVTATGAELLGRLANDTGHFLAIEDWIAAGGMLAFVGGPGVPNLLAEHSALGQLIPGTVSKTVVLSRGRRRDRTIRGNQFHGSLTCTESSRRLKGTFRWSCARRVDWDNWCLSPCRSMRRRGLTGPDATRSWPGC
jgi:hypothetical protein